MYDRQDYKFDVAEAVQQLHRAAAPDSAEFIEGARLVFEVCGWAYLYCYVSRYGGGGTARRMTGAAPEADPAAMPKTTITICRKGEAGENGAC